MKLSKEDLGIIESASEKEYPTPEFKEWWDNALRVSFWKCPECGRLRKRESKEKLVMVICKNCQVEMEVCG